MDQLSDSQVLQVVSGDGQFNSNGVEQFVKEAGVEASGVNYTVVAIMGPQSSGKSTLLNHLVRFCRRAASGRQRSRRSLAPPHRGPRSPVAALLTRPHPLPRRSLARGSRRWTR